MSCVLNDKELEAKLHELGLQYYDAYIEENKDEIEQLKNNILVFAYEFVFKNINKVYKIANEFEKQEVCSKTILTLLDKLDKNEYNPYYNEEESKFCAYIRTIMRGHALNSYKKMKNEKHKYEIEYETKYDMRPPVVLENIKEENVDHFRNVQLEELIEKILSIAENDEERNFINTVFIERVLYDNISNKEIAETLGCSPAYVSKKIKILKEKLQEVLKNYYNLE